MAIWNIGINVLAQKRQAQFIQGQQAPWVGPGHRARCRTVSLAHCHNSIGLRLAHLCNPGPQLTPGQKGVEKILERWYRLPSDHDFSMQ